MFTLILGSSGRKRGREKWCGQRSGGTTPRGTIKPNEKSDQSLGTAVVQ